VALAVGRGRRAALAAGASIGLITVVAILLSFWVSGMSPFLSSIFLALATGTFLYVGTTILIPLSEAGRSRWAILSVVLGFGGFVLTAWAAGRFLGE
jgi:zinc transporter ZupT